MPIYSYPAIDYKTWIVKGKIEKSYFNDGVCFQEPTLAITVKLLHVRTNTKLYTIHTHSFLQTYLSPMVKNAYIVYKKGWC